MRRFRMLASLALAASLMASPSLVLGQTDDRPSGLTTPLALAPDGQLPLEGTPWRLRGYRWRGADRVPGPEVAAWLTLAPGSLQASGGCTSFKGRYGAVGSAIRFELGDLQDDSCAEQTTMVQLAMVDGLRKATSFEITMTAEGSEDQLVLRNASGMELLRFGPDDSRPLDAGEWRLVSYSAAGVVTSADPGQPAVLSFRATRDDEAQRVSSGPASGSTGCNGFVGEFYRHADVISFGELERTDAPCTPALASQEAAMSSVLDATSMQLSFPPDGLVITATDSGDSLEFEAARRLEDSTWLLARIPGAARPEDAVTLRMSAGRLSGEGPCGPYSAEYVADAGFVTFSRVMGAADDACETPGLEKALLSALRHTVRLEHDQAQLRLLDARGRVTARFKAPTGP